MSGLVLILVVACVYALPGRAYAAPRAEADAPASVESQDAGAGRRVLLPLIRAGKPAPVTGSIYYLIPVLPPSTDRPAARHGDLNLDLRSYSATSQALDLVDYTGNTDTGAPQMTGIFSDNRRPAFTSTYRVYDWDWGCSAEGCRGKPLNYPPVTLLGLATRPGEFVSAPRRAAEIYAGGYTVLVLYAEPTRITLKYTREDNVVSGYTVHFERIDVDADLLALYRQADAAGRAHLPALKNGQPLGLAAGSEVLVAIRDCGTFLDPRSRKDWWQGQ